MKNCPKCGKELNDDVAFCTECGEALEVVEAAPEAPKAAPEAPKAAPKKNVSKILGIVGIVASLFIPLAGFIVSIIGIVLGVKEMKATGNKTGLILSIIGLVLSILCWIFNMIFSALFLPMFMVMFEELMYSLS